MSDCAIIIFHTEREKEVSPAVYLHWHAGLVLALLETARPQMRSNDAGYSCARFIGCCHDAIPGERSLGVHNLPGHAAAVRDRNTPDEFERMMDAARKFDYGGRGVFLVDVDRWRVEHAGTCLCDFGDIGDGFGMQESTGLTSENGVVQLPLKNK